MSAPAFTPGPWQQMKTDASVDDNATFCDDNSVQRIGTWCGIGNPEHTDPIVAIAVFDGSHDDPEFDANINLIAAAPELYEYVASSASNGCATAQSLIAKARGEQ